MAQKAISKYPDIYTKYWIDGMRKKLDYLMKKKEDEYLIEECFND